MLIIPVFTIYAPVCAINAICESNFNNELMCAGPASYRYHSFAYQFTKSDQIFLFNFNLHCCKMGNLDKRRSTMIGGWGENIDDDWRVRNWNLKMAVAG